MPSYKIIQRPDYVHKNGKCPIWLQVFIKGKRARLPLGVGVEVEYFDKAKGMVKKIPKNGGETELLNAIINKAQEKCNRIFNEAVLYGKPLSIAAFLLEYNAEGVAKASFTEFFKKQILLQTDKAENTVRSYHSTFNFFTAFRKDVSFGELTYETIEGFDKYLRKHSSSDTNTLHKHHKIVKKFVNLAIAKGNKIVNPYDSFKTKTAEVEIEYLTLDEVLKLKDLYEAATLERHLQKVLRYYLFSVTCNGLRFSDVAQIEPDNIVGDFLVFTPIKTVNSRKTLTVALSAYGKRLIADALSDRERVRKTIFTVISNQKTNAAMAKIALLVGIKKACTFHSARHTFATLYLAKNKDAAMLQKILGHAQINTTMKYVHIANDQKLEQMLVFDELFNF